MSRLGMGVVINKHHNLIAVDIRKESDVIRESHDMILADVIDTGYLVKDSLLAEKLEKLSAEDRSKIYDVIDTMLKHSTQVKP
ncbi:MAG: hypothetical protein E6066_11535 [Oscillospiraceae bacterium]|nr:hypothetical protein [Oscillospiraceae bacterium]